MTTVNKHQFNTVCLQDKCFNDLVFYSEFSKITWHLLAK
jgi:hypothetical protein